MVSSSPASEEDGPLAPPEAPVEPRQVARGAVVFDLDGTILDDLDLISQVAAAVLEETFGTPKTEGRIHYLATTGMPFEAQLAQLYPEAPEVLRRRTARTFHERKIRDAYANATPFPEIPRVLKRLSQAEWTLAISTGAEREMADLLLEREGLRYWFEGVLGSAQGTKREHLVEYARRFPGVPVFLVGDSRFDMEVAGHVAGVRTLGRASTLPGWSLTPHDLKRWGAVWADYSLATLPEALETLVSQKRKASPSRTRRNRAPSRRRSVPR